MPMISVLVDQLRVCDSLRQVSFGASVLRAGCASCELTFLSKPHGNGLFAFHLLTNRITGAPAGGAGSQAAECPFLFLFLIYLFFYPSAPYLGLFNGSWLPEPCESFCFFFPSSTVQ